MKNEPDFFGVFATLFILSVIVFIMGLILTSVHGWDGLINGVEIKDGVIGSSIGIILFFILSLGVHKSK